MLDLDAKYEVITYAVGDTKAGTKMGKLQLKNLSDESTLNCILWEEALNRIDPKMFRTGNTVKVLTASYNERYNNCLVSALELVKEAKLGLSEDEREAKYKKITDCVENFKDKDLACFTLSNLEKNKELFKITPAAKLMHHNYIGGLVQHTVECIEFAEILYPKICNIISKDELMCACILHDIGKTFEYTVDIETGLIEYNEEFQKDWITHSQYGYTLCMAAGYKKIAKMIASHHSRSDWGALIDLGQKDLEPFYYLVHHIDDLSAKFGKIYVNNL